MENLIDKAIEMLPERPNEPKAEKVDTREPVKALERLIEGLERARWSWMEYK